MSEAATAKRPLDEVMLAMDVVDTLRHQQILVQRELNAENREQRLIDRLREIYAAQGMEVTDAILAEGVRALEEDRFVYTPPPKSFSVKLARLYVNRQKWLKRAGNVLAVLLVIWGLYYFFISGPAQREIREQATAINTNLHTLDGQMQDLDANIQHLSAALPRVGLQLDAQLRGAADARKLQAGASLTKAKELLTSARVLSRDDKVDGDDLQQEGPLIRERLGKQQTLVNKATAAVDQAAGSLLVISSLQGLPAELALQRDAILVGAKDDAALVQARNQYALGMNALRSGDIDAANKAASTLRNLQAQLTLSYTLRVVSEPGEYSAFWRIPDTNTKTQNYYVVVEAISADGSILSLPVTSEEDGLTRNVKRWGVRVDSQTYARIAADKKDDGIVQNRSFGLKQPGYLQPEYNYAVRNGNITQW